MTRGPTTPIGAYPQTRMRRNRRYDWTRRMVRENQLSPDDLIWPLFVRVGTDTAEEIPTLPGVMRRTVDLLADAVGEAKSLGIPAIALFPAIDPDLKTPMAEEAWNPDNLVCQAIRTIKDAHRFDFSGKHNGTDFHYVRIIGFEGQRAYKVTLGASEANYKRLSYKFDNLLRSFKVK